MSRSRLFSKLIIPITLLTIYSITLIKTATTPVETTSSEDQAVQTTNTLQSLAVEVENNNDIPRPPQAPPASNAVSNIPETLRFVELTDPKMIPASQATWLQPDDVILGIVHDGEAQAFPLKQMAFHHIVNARVGGDPYLITYCGFCDGYARSFQATIDDVRYTFNVYGTYENALALIDRQTGSVWHQLDGKLLSGPQAAEELYLQPHILTQATWKDWQKLYPDSKVLPQYTDYLDQYSQINLIFNASQNQEPDFPYNDTRLPADTFVLGTNIGIFYRAYVIKGIDDNPGVINDTLNGVPIVIFFDTSKGIATVFLASIKDQTLSFSMESNRIVDDTGSIWDMSGKAIRGVYRGNQLLPLASLLTQWSSWATYHPGTSIYGQ